MEVRSFKKRIYINYRKRRQAPKKYIYVLIIIYGAKKKMKIYELKPITSQKSFYSKAVVQVDDDGNETLYSYGTPIIEKLADGTYKKLWDGWTATTGKHIKAFSGLNKAAFIGLE